jgi:hypothetical protein
MGGLGFNMRSTGLKKADDGLPQNGLYSMFVRAGSGNGQYHKRNFGKKEGENDEEDDKLKAKQAKRAKKEKREKEEKEEETEEEEVCYY